MIQKLKALGLPLRTMNLCMMITALVLTVVLLVLTLWTSSVFTDLRRATDEYLAGQDATYLINGASELLTREAQEFVSSGDPVHLDSYFQELLVDRRRDQAVAKMPGKVENTATYQRLLSALESSDALSDLECYGMALAASGYRLDLKALPEPLQAVTLDAADAALPPQEQILKAENLVSGETYYTLKGKVEGEMEQCLLEMVSRVKSRQDSDQEQMGRLLLLVRLAIVLFAAAVLFFLWLNYSLGIRPVLQGVERIREDSSIPVAGAAEVRYLAQFYNKMFETYRKDISHLNYEASHDKLTGAYNRVGYELLRQELDLNNTALLMVDLDRFKSINDTYGHDAGDRVLVHLVRVLNDHFRSEDFVCRLGGDEFAVFMVHSYPEYENLIREKVRRINEQMQHPPGGVMPVTVSVGVAFGENIPDYEALLERADAALYQAKRQGRSTCCFYHA